LAVRVRVELAVDPAVRAALAVPEDQVVPVARAALAVPEDQVVPAVRAALVVPENPVAPVGLAVQVAPVGPAVRVAPVGPAGQVAPVALANRVALELVPAEAGPVQDHRPAQLAVALRTKSVIAAHHPDQVPLLAVAEDLAAAVAETTREPAAAEVVIAWEAADTVAAAGPE
jgi:hypothetical protein